MRSAGFNIAAIGQLKMQTALAHQMLSEGRDSSRQVLEDVAAEAYRMHWLTEHQLATILSLNRYELDGFLKSREI